MIRRPGCGHDGAGMARWLAGSRWSTRPNLRWSRRSARLGLLAPGEAPRFERLTGGVSSDIWRVDLARGPVCVKRALAKLRVAADWRAPIERNAYEAAWMRHAAAIVPDAVPRLLGQDREAGVLVMAYLPRRAGTRGWKADLLAGRAEPEVARGGRRAPRRRSTPARRTTATIAAAFPTDRIFHDIRLEPYLEATARAHPDRAEALHRLVQVDRRHQDRPGARRRQPQEHPGRARRAGLSRRRVRLVRRSGVRSGVLPQPPAAEVPVRCPPRRRISSSCFDGSGRQPISAASPGSRRPRSRRARRASCRACCSAASTASRRSSI